MTEDDISWLNFFNPRIVNYQPDSKNIKNFPQNKITNDKITLYRYLAEPPKFPFTEFKWWTEIKTDSPDIASGSTGILFHASMYRIEWSFPEGEANHIVKAGQRRMVPRYPMAIEYQNLRIVESHECCVIKIP